jgi:hypothetical protein
MALLAFAALLSAPAARAAQSYNNCAGTIAGVPTTIVASGTWCLDADIATSMTSSAAITVNADNVVIDCNDFLLDGSGGGANSTAVAIQSGGHSNITIRNCRIKGFYRGAWFQGPGSAGHVVENNLFDGNLYAAVELEGDGSTIRRNRIFSTGGAVDVAGIRITSAVDVRDNTIYGVTAKVGGNGNAFGIVGTGSASGSITGNRIRGLAKDGGGSPFGIVNLGSTRMIVRRNDLVGDGTGIGLLCSSATTRVRDNTLSAWATAIDTCASGAGNVVRP